VNRSSDTRIVRSDGLDLAVEEFGSGMPLIFAHGLTSNRAQSAERCAAGGALPRDRLRPARPRRVVAGR